MKKLKAVLSIILVLIIALGGSGCMQNNGRGFVSYLEHKYPNDNFEFVENIYPCADFEGGALFGGGRLKIARCISENIPNYKIYVVYDTEDKVYSDNYLDMKYADQLDDVLDTVFNTAFPDENYYYTSAKEMFYSTTKSNKLNSNISFAEYKQKRGIPLYAFVSNYSNKSRDEIVKNLEQTIIKENLYCDTVDIYIVDDYSADINNNSSLRTNVVVNEKYKDCLSATMINDNGFDSVEWESEQY